MLALILGAALTGTAQAAAPFRYDRELGDVARASLVRAVSDGRPFSRADVKRVYVRCYRDKKTFERVFLERYGIPAGRVVAYYAGGRRPPPSGRHLRQRPGVPLRAAHRVHGGAPTPFSCTRRCTGRVSEIERLTSCLANEAVRWGAERFGFDEAKALRARNLAFAYTRLFGPPLYRMATPNCLALTRRTEWPDHVEPDG